MILIILFFTFVIAALLRRTHRQISVILKLLATLFFALTCWGLSTKYALEYIQTYPRLEKIKWGDNNVIIVLGGGSSVWKDQSLTPQNLVMSRLFEAVRLYNNCRSSQNACNILVSGGDPSGLKISEAVTMQKSLSELGVPAQDILIEKQSYDTEQNAKFTAEILKNHRFDQKVLVTSGFHMKRALKWFSYEKINCLAAPSDFIQAEIGPLPRSRHLYHFDLVLHEGLGLIEYTLKSVF